MNSRTAACRLIKVGIAMVVAPFLVAATPVSAPPTAQTCPSVQRPLPDPAELARLQRELEALADTAETSGERLRLLDRIAGLHQPLEEEYDQTPEPALLQGLRLREKLGRIGDPQYAQALFRVGVLQWARSRSDLAEATLLQCRTEAGKSGGRESANYAYCQHWLGVVYNELGQYAEAEQALRDSAAIRERLLGPQHPDTAYALFTLGSVYISLADWERAEQSNLRALAIREAAFGRCGRLVGDSFNSLGFIYRESARPALAVPAYERALEIRAAWLGAEDPLVAQSMSNLGLALTDLGRHGEARALLEKSLEIRDRTLGPVHHRTVIGVWNLVQSRRAERRLLDSGSLLERGLHGAFAAGDPKLVWRFQDAYRDYYQQRRESDLAIFFGKLAVNTIQSLRMRLTAIERALQRSFLEDKTSVYRDLADLMIEQGRLAEAQQVLGMLKEEEFFDFISRSESDDPRARAIMFLPHEQPWQARLEALQAKATREELDRYLSEARAAFAKLDLVARDVAGAEENRDALQKLLSQLGAGSVMLHFVRGGERLNIIMTTATSQNAKQVALRASELNRQIDRLRRVLRTPKTNPLPAAQDLYQTLIAPIAVDLERAQARTLMFYLDGALRYIPMAVLHDGKHYLAERYALAVYTEVARDNLTRVPQTGRTLAGLGLTRAIDDYSALPAVKAELQAIGGILPAELHFDQAFSASRLQSSLSHPLVHVASHFVFRPGTEASSFLLLGDGDRLTLKRIRDEKFDFSRVDLLTLSACDTGVGGGRDSQGQEVEGLGALVQRQGARGVIATLWPVADESTAQFMQNLYRLSEKVGLNKAEALRQAQVLMIQGQATSTDGDAQSSLTQGAPAATAKRSFAHPYFWAPFILMGNWL
jgi:CHAT domain-containing protein